MNNAHDRNLPLLSVLSLRVFIPFGIGFFLSDLFRTVNAVIASDLRADLDVGAAELCLLTSAFFLAFVCCQIPVGVLLDRHGPRRVEALLLLVAGAGAWIFALSQGFGGAALGRILIGVGASACLMAGFKAFALWFDPQRLALLNGYLLAFGAFGGVAATAPVEAFVQFWSWRAVFGTLALACVAGSALLWFAAPERHQEAQPQPLRVQLQGVLSVIRSRCFWRRHRQRSSP